LDWGNYDTSSDEVNALLNRFFKHIKQVNTVLTHSDYQQLTSKWQLADGFTLKSLQKRWRQQALKNHPDKPGGCDIKFKQIKIEYEQLRSAAR
jgi:hypothetical protein